MDLAAQRYEQFKTIMEENTGGHPVEIRYGESMTEGLPAIRLFLYRGYPQPQFLTVVTYGLSLAEHPSWSDQRPELMICVGSSDDYVWVGAIGVLADAGRKQGFEFNLNMVLTFNYPIAPPSAMQGLLVGPPTKLPVNPIQLKERTVVIKTVVPIYQGEAVLSWEELVGRVGEEQLKNVNRPDVSSGAKLTVNLTEGDLTRMVSDVVKPLAAELARAGHLHDSDYYRDGMKVVGGNLEGMTRVLCDSAVLMMNGVPKDTVRKAVTPYFVRQDCPQQIVSVIVDRLDEGVNRFKGTFDLAAEFQKHEELLRLSWFRITVAEFVAKYGPPAEKIAVPAAAPAERATAAAAEARSSKRWWKFWG